MKKLISVLLVLSVMLCCLAPLAMAEPECGTIRIRLNSNVAGCTEQDVDKLIELLSPQVTWYNNPSNPVSIANAAGGAEHAHMEAGREYAITYMLKAADGYELPAELADGDVEFECGEGVTVIYCKIAEMHVPGGDKYARTRAIRIIAKVIPDYTFMQRIIGIIKDIILKIRSWQLY